MTWTQERHLPERAVSWAEGILGRRVTASAALTGGSSNQCHRLELEDGALAVLRCWTSRQHRDLWEFSAAREAAALALVRTSNCPVPDVLALDATGDRSDVPALLLEHAQGERPGTRDLADLDVGLLASAIAAVHDVVAPLSLPAFRPWCWRHELEAPIGSEARPEWSRLLEAAAAPDDEQTAGRSLLHGDFHIGNTLWAGGALSAVLDWPTASRGNPMADVARMAVLLDLVCGRGAAFVDAYGALTGRHLSAWWEARELLDRLPEDPADPVDLRLFDDQVRRVAARL